MNQSATKLQYDGTPLHYGPARTLFPMIWKILYRLRYVGCFLLGVTAFWPVLSTWFLADDFGHLRWHEHVSGLETFLTANGMFYRPLSTFLTWNLGYALFGTNALPYHAVSLVLHGLTAALLGKAIATVSSNERTGWISGALFAVYPLCTEPVVWLAAQWDLWAAVCATAAILGFAHAWRTRRRSSYFLGWLAALCGVFMKEIVLPLPAIIPFVALATEMSAKEGETKAWPGSRPERMALLKRIVLWSAPFAVPSLVFVIVRLLGRGSLGGYESARSDYHLFFWDALTSAARFMIMPLNRQVFDATLVQVVGSASSMLVLIGLFVFGRRHWHLHLLALVWWLVFLVPVLNLILLTSDATRGNRIFYFSLMGFMVSMAALISAAMDHRRARGALAGLVGLGILVSIPATWKQLEPWQQASRQAERLVYEMSREIVPVPYPPAQVNIKNLPLEYKGAFVFWNGLEEAVRIFGRRQIAVATVDELDHTLLGAPFLANRNGVYNVELTMDPQRQLYHVKDIRGATAGGMPPPAGDAHTWDYARCPEMPGGWQPTNSTFTCSQEQASPGSSGTYATFKPSNDDSYLTLPTLPLSLEGNSFVRVGIHARLAENREGRSGQLFWATRQPGEWLEKRSITYALEPSRQWRIYWIYVPVSKLEALEHGLRLDPVRGPEGETVSIDIAWISITAVP